MKAKVIDVNGAELRQIELNDEIFNRKPNKSVIYEAIKNELANRRQGTHSTKTKAEVSGSGAKPFKQKGTGRARVGTKRNPVWYHGGVAFGPKPRDYSYVLPKKVKRLAYKSILSMKNIDSNIIFIDQVNVAEGKTKELKDILDKVANGFKTTIIVAGTEKDLLIKRAGRNLPKVKCLSYNRLSAHTLYYSEKLVITEEAAKLLDVFYGKVKEEA